MVAWIRENAVLASVLGALIAVISTVAVDRYQLSGLVTAQPAIQAHINDSTRHIDPNRDPEKMKKLEEKVDQLERQLRWMERRQGGNQPGWEGRRGQR